MSTGLKGLLRLQNMRGTDFVQIFNGHTSYAGTIDVFSQPLEALDDVIEAFRSILRGNAKIVSQKSHLFPDMVNNVAVYGQASVGWNPGRLWEEDEEHIVP